MPNHVTNILSFEDIPYEQIKEILEAIKNDEYGIGSIDFNKIIPMPENIFRGNLGTEERKLYGSDNWYDWSIENWGTKWNGYDFAPFEEGQRSIEFNTAWATVLPVIEALSEKYPDAVIKIRWSDEDFGYNVGEREYQNGESIYEYEPEGGSKAAYELAADIHDYDLAEEGYRLSEDGTTYEYVDSDFEEEAPPPESIKVVLVKPMQKPVIAEIGTELKDLQGMVGGLIEAVYPFEEQVAIVCNEEGKMNGLTLNRALKDEDGKIADIIAGDFFICDASGENFGSLNDGQLAKYSEMFKNPERFYQINDEIVAVPIADSKASVQER